MGNTRSSLLRSADARFWIEVGCSAASAFLFVLTYFVHEWVEAVFRIDPDRHSGSLEWALDGVFLLIAITAGVLARIEWRRLAVARADPLSSS
jgi:hypothetical protein